MVIIFEKEYLKELYEEKRARSKKYRFQPNVVSKYIQTIDKLRAANDVEELYPIKSLNYVKLRGDKLGIESVRVDSKYRIEFYTTIEGEEPESITICSIVELSNHYK